MKIRSCFFLLNIFFTLLSCNSSSDNTSVDDASIATESDLNQMENRENDTGEPIDKVLSTIYVVSLNGVEMIQDSVKKQLVLGTIPYATKLKVLEDGKEWYAVEYYITRETIEGSRVIKSSSFEKVYILKSNKVAKFKNVKLIPSDLTKTTVFSTLNKSKHIESGKQLKDYLTLELITDSVFNSKKKSAIEFLVFDTLEHKKIDGIIELKCHNKKKTFVDKNTGNEDEESFEYVGQFEFLNTYVINGHYWESHDYKFVDKTSGEEVITLEEYPVISPDKKHLVCVYANPYETTADLELYSISGIKIDRILNVSFTYWMPTVDPSEIFWSNDGFIYLSVNHKNVFWKESGHNNDRCQYIRIEVL